MAKAKKKKYSASDKAILGIGYVLLGAFVLSILVPLLYVVIASFMDPNVLNSQGISFDVRKWTIDFYPDQSVASGKYNLGNPASGCV